MALSDCVLPQGVWRLAHRGILNGATGVVYQNSMAWGTGVIISSVFVEESDTRAGLLMISTATLAYGGMQVDALRGGCHIGSLHRSSLRLQLCHFKLHSMPLLG